jgi:hypothetical protein
VVIFEIKDFPGLIIYVSLDCLNQLSNYSDQQQQHPHRGYETRRTRPERTETTSSAEEHPVNEDMDIDDLLKHWKTKKKAKRNS